MLEELRLAISPYFLHIKWLHVVSAGIWSFSTAVAYAWYLKPILRRAYQNPGDDALRARRDEWMHRFDRGAALEHYALVVMTATALLMMWIMQIDLSHWSYVSAKLWIGILVILPLEVIDIWLAHLGGNKKRVRATGDVDRYERVMARHWLFLRISEPIVVVLIPAMFYLAIVKPF